jgi:Ku protein
MASDKRAGMPTTVWSRSRIWMAREPFLLAIWFEMPYYLSVEEPVGQEAFSAIRDAMAAHKMVGIAKLVISRRERAVMLEPRGKSIVLRTLRYGDEIRDEEACFEGVGDGVADPDIMTLVQQLIKQQTRPPRVVSAGNLERRAKERLMHGAA